MRPTLSTALAIAVVAITVQGARPAAAPQGFAAQQAQPRGTLRAAAGDRAVQQIATRIRTDADALRRALDENRGRQDRYRRSPEDDIQYAVDDVVTAADHLADHSARNQVIQLDVDDLMRRGTALENAVLNGQPTAGVRSAWTTLQRDLDAAASAFGQTWNWRNPTYAPTSTGGAFYERLSGTYELDAARSDDPRRTLNQAMQRQSANRRGQIRKDLGDRLSPPEIISIERNGNQVTLASSDAPRATFDANGRLISERRGARNSTMRASIYGDRLEITTNGNGGDDYRVTFEPLDGGRSMRLTREIYAEGLAQPVIVRSEYRRTSDRADWQVFNGRSRDVVGTSGNAGGGAILDGTTLTATLEAPINIRNVRENDRINLTVRNAPEARLENAVLEGYVTRVPGANDRGGVGIAFDRIRLTNGRSADFSATVENVRGPNGESISFDGEQADSGPQRDEAIQRGAIGAAVGAIVGAIAGGGKGAAIGAVVGAGGGAATVMINGQRQTELPRGTQFTVRTRGDSEWIR